MHDDPGKNRWRLVIAASLMMFVAQLDATIVNVALPSIEADLGTRTALVQWVVLGYLAPLIGLSLSAGRWVDVADPRRALQLSCVGFGLASVAAGLAPSLGWLIAARVVQGCFAVVMLSLTPVLATAAVRPQARARAFGFVMLFGTLGGMIGPVLGGQLVQAYGWPWIFYVNLLVVLGVIVLASRELPLGRRLPWPERRWLPEALTFGGGAVAVLIGLSLSVGVAPAWALIALVAAPLMLVWSRLPGTAGVRRLMSTPGVTGPHLALTLCYTGLFMVMFVAPFFLQDTLDVSPGATGLALLAFPAAASLASLAAGALADRIGARPIALTGAAVMVAGLGLLTLLDRSSGAEQLAYYFAVAGVGFGFFNGQVQVLAMSSTPAGQLGVTGGTTNLVRQLGVALGSAAGAGLWTVQSTGTDGMRQSAALAAALALGVAVTVAVTARGRRPAPAVSAA